MRLAVYCRGCGAFAVDEHAVRCADGIRFNVEHTHGPACPLLKHLCVHGTIDMDWIECREGDDALEGDFAPPSEGGLAS